ncbi:peroxidase family protein [Taklimakanibacter lacteus]|uniref:peroxidase family protein n=1 Tax=Taklimakanibacter lacteus TaxID=2268456 RepID=UPI0013C473C8
MFDIGGARADIDILDADPTSGYPFRFTRALTEGANQPSIRVLTELGKAMTSDALNVGDSTIPAGYSYLGQFIAHETTHNETAYKEYRNVKDMKQAASPRLDLDSIYGKLDFRSFNTPPFHLPMGYTTPSSHIPPLKCRSFPRDLPRDENGKTTIADTRNDGNVTVAQMHIALMRFHNAIATLLHESRQRHTMDDVVEMTVQHFQSVVLHDFLPRITDPDVYADIRDNGSVWFPNVLKDRTDPLPMPIEFAMAAFRFGHSMIRPSYGHWNPYVSPDISDMFDLTNENGSLKSPLPSEWIINWRKFFPPPFLGGASLAGLIYSRPIDTRIAIPLGTLPDRVLASPDPSNNLAVRTLLFGQALGLPSGQAAAAELNVLLRCAGRAEINILSEKQVLADENSAILGQEKLAIETPLWFYILKEAKIQQSGNALGQLGSRIVIEVLRALIERCQNSILDPKRPWSPTLPRSQDEHFTMIDLLNFSGGLNVYEELGPCPEP